MSSTNPVTELVDSLLSNLSEEEISSNRLFPLRFSEPVERSIHQDLLDTDFKDIVPKKGDNLLIDDPEGYWGKDLEPVIFDPSWPVFVVGNKWGPYKSIEVDAWKEIAIRWVAPRDTISSFINISLSDHAPEMSFAEATVGPLGGFGLNRYNWVSHYAETGYEGHGFQSIEDSHQEFVSIIKKYKKIS